MINILFRIFIVSVSVICFAETGIDIETLPNLRTQQYPIGPYKKIIVLSAPRTGSSLVYNIFRFLFEEDSKIFSNHNVFDQNKFVLRTHIFSDLDLIEDENILYIFTIRNPRDAIISNYRICPRTITNNRQFAQELVNRHQTYLYFFEQLEANGRNVAWLKYEEFAQDIDWILNFIENHFRISINPIDRELIKSGYSKENVYSCTEKFSGFKDYLPISGFHGKHIALEKYTPPQEFLYWLNIYLRKIQPLLRKYGYDLNPVEAKT